MGVGEWAWSADRCEGGGQGEREKGRGLVKMAAEEEAVLR